MKNMKYTKLSTILGSLSLLLSACGGNAPTSSDENATFSSESERESSVNAQTINAMLYFEGSCDFLRRCSAWTQNGVVTMGCDEKACSDEEAWVAGPNEQACGEKIKICYQGNCIEARVRDISVIGGWEGNVAVFKALKLAYKIPYPGCSGGSGGDKVIIYRGETSSAATNTASSGTTSANSAASASGNYGSCWYSGKQGTCQDYRGCAGASYTGLCPGSDVIQCCITYQSSSNQSQSTGTCSAYGKQGTCQDYRSCSGTRYTGLCPGAAEIQCCVTNTNQSQSLGTCWAYGHQGTCQDYRSCSGTKYTGLCPGAANIQCCVRQNDLGRVRVDEFIRSRISRGIGYGQTKIYHGIFA